MKALLVMVILGLAVSACGIKDDPFPVTEEE